MHTFKEMLSDYGIKLDTLTTKCTTDASHLLSSEQNFVIVTTTGKDEIGGSGADPFTRASLYYRKLIHRCGRHGILELRSLFPCLNIVVVGNCFG